MAHTFAVLFLISCFLRASAAANNGEDIRLPLRGDEYGDFYVTVKLGTPTRDFTLLFDTGSSLSWVQCEPCSGSCNAQGQFFDPSNSSTYSDATCDQTCDYQMLYNDGSFSNGYYIKDTLTLSPKGILDDFIFGCARTIGGGSFSDADGVLGTGPGRESLMAQTDTRYFSTFCYCLPASQDSTGFLVFGVQAFETCQPDTDRMVPLAVRTQEDKYTSYYVHLLGITIGERRIEIPKTTIDSGTSITRLTSSVYSALTSAFGEIMSGYTPAPPTEDFDVCYYNRGGQSSLAPPIMLLHFENSIDVTLDPSAVTSSESDSRICLPFIKTEYDENIIGNQQHRELQVFYDTSNGKLGFSKGGCAT